MVLEIMVSVVHEENLTKNNIKVEKAETYNLESMVIYQEFIREEVKLSCENNIVCEMMTRYKINIEEALCFPKTRVIN